MKQISPYGSWQSAITAEKMTAKNIGFSFPRFFDKTLFWMEFRPNESARTVIVRRRADGQIQTFTPEGCSVQTKAHEYGGCCYTVGAGHLYFVNAKDQRIYRQNLYGNSIAEAVSPKQEAATEYRFADLVYDAPRERVIAVAEVHKSASEEPEAMLIALPKGSEEMEAITLGSDFYACPRLSPDGKHILWLQWDHPNMPWDQTELWQADFDNQGQLTQKIRLSADNEAIFQPEWSADNKIYFISDRNEYWNLYRHELDQPTALFPTSLDCGLPLWQFGMTTWGFLSDSKILVSGCQGGEWQLLRVDTVTGEAAQVLSDSPTAYNHYENLTTDSATGEAAVIASSPTVKSNLCTLENGGIKTLISSGELELSDKDISLPTPFRFPTTENDEAYGYYYAPTNSRHEADKNEKPPLIILCHGGPTASTSAAFNLKVQFWTSRGFAVADVNYRGSTGYGRSYREKLKGNWGIYDVDDACAAAEYAVEQGWADSERLIIRGSSAGGYTVLSALCFKEVFSAGSSLYGIGDLNTLANDTHKFEARYTDSLIAPLEESTIYAERSPINHIQGFDCPTIFFQGLKDKVVPPEQAESMVAALDEKHIPVSFITYPEEAHGFRQTENIIHAFNAELAFYGKVFGFDTDSTVNNLQVMNLTPH